jgi:hypothetical protein
VVNFGFANDNAKKAESAMTAKDFELINSNFVITLVNIKLVIVN